MGPLTGIRHSYSNTAARDLFFESVKLGPYPSWSLSLSGKSHALEERNEARIAPQIVEALVDCDARLGKTTVAFCNGSIEPGEDVRRIP